MGEQKEQSKVIQFPDPERVSRSEIEVLYLDHASYVTGTVTGILGFDPDIEDIVQQTFTIAFEKLHTLRKKESVRFWLAGIAINLCRRNLRKKALLRRLGFGADEIDIPQEQQTENTVLLRQLYSVLMTLPSDERIAWALRRVEGEDFATVALMCDCSISTAKRRVSRAEAVLKRALDE